MSIDTKKSREDGDKAGDSAGAEAVADLKKCQKDIVSFRHMCDKQIDEIEKSYVANVRPFLEKRATIIQNIPRFWSRAVLDHPLLSTVFEPGESEVIGYLTGLDVDEDPKHRDYFKIHFSFRKNPYFENRTLTKEFKENGSSNSTIRWRKGQQFPRVTKHELWEDDDLGLEYKGFFRWFLDPNEHYCDPIGDIIRSCIWYNPMEFYDRKQIRPHQQVHATMEGSGPSAELSRRTSKDEKTLRKHKSSSARSEH